MMMHRMGFEPMNPKGRALKARAFLWAMYLELPNGNFIQTLITDHFAICALIAVFAGSI